MDSLVMEATNLHQELRMKEKKNQREKKEGKKRGLFTVIYGKQKRERRDLAEMDDFVGFPCSIWIVVSYVLLI